MNSRWTEIWVAGGRNQHAVAQVVASHSDNPGHHTNINTIFDGRASCSLEALRFA